MGGGGRGVDCGLKINIMRGEGGSTIALDEIEHITLNNDLRVMLHNDEYTKSILS